MNPDFFAVRQEEVKICPDPQRDIKLAPLRLHGDDMVATLRLSGFTFAGIGAQSPHDMRSSGTFEP